LRACILILLLVSTWAQAQCYRMDSFIAIDEPEIYPITGTVFLQFENDGTRQVIFQDDFETVQGVELRVYLTTTERLNQGGEELEITLEPLQDDNGGMDSGDTISGLQVFDIPQEVGLDDFDFVIVQCVPANVQWGRAALGEIQGPDCESLSIDDLVDNTLDFFPNPASEGIQFTQTNPTLKISIFDNLGREVFTQTGTENIALSFLSNGIYFIRLQKDESATTRKLIIE